MEIKEEQEPIKEVFTWKVDAPAPEEEMLEFWKKLRHFYRTGEKGLEKDGEFRSALLDLLETGNSTIPFQPAGDKGPSIEFGERAPFLMLDFLLSQHQKENRKKFKYRLSELAESLQQLLQVEDKASEAKELKDTYDFADEMIAFDQMVAMIPHSANEELSESRKNRLQDVFSMLTAGLAHFSDHEATMVIEKGIDKNWVDSNLFQNIQLIEEEKDAFNRTQQIFIDQISSFSELIKAYRIAGLEVGGEYKEDIHNEYFENFSWHRLFEEELNLFHPIVLIVEHAYVFDNLTSFSRLLASNQPINVLVLNRELISSPKTMISWEDASHQFRQELAALTISHRNVYTFQAGMDHAAYLYEGLENCLRSTAPGVCHISITGVKSGSGDSRLALATAATAGRYFPRIHYDPNKGTEWRKKFDLRGNTQAENKWPKYTLQASTSKDPGLTMDVAFTYADYKAGYAEKAGELMLIPFKFNNEYLIPLSEYLGLEDRDLYGKIPYIWLQNKDKELIRAAVPNVWVVSCQERLDFWSFLQELGGVKTSQAGEVLEIEDGEQKKEAEAETTGAGNEKESVSEEAIAMAAERLIRVLLEGEDPPDEAPETGGDSISEKKGG